MNLKSRRNLRTDHTSHIAGIIGAGLAIDICIENGVDNLEIGSNSEYLINAINRQIKAVANVDLLDSLYVQQNCPVKLGHYIADE